MGESDIRTLLPLDRWAQIIGLNPLHFRQVHSEYMPHATCTRVWKEHAWQEADQISRDCIAEAIQQAEGMFADTLGYKLLPVWEISEMHHTPKPADMALYNVHGLDPQMYNLSLRLNWGHYVIGGQEARVLVEAGVAITYSDPDGDGYNELATIEFDTVATEEEIMVLYPGETEDRWEIRPFRTCVIADGTATVTFWRHQFVMPELIEAFAPEAADGENDGHFLETVDVWRRYNDPAVMAWLVWDSHPGGCTNDCTQTVQSACLIPRNFESSMVGYQPAEWNGETYTPVQFEICRNPDQIQVCYKAGYRDMRRTYPYIQMAQDWERAVAYYSLTLLRRDICGCSNAEAMMQRWSEDLSLRLPEKAYDMSDDIRDNPLGTTRAAQYAWRLIRQRRLASPINY